MKIFMKTIVVSLALTTRLFAVSHPLDPLTPFEISQAVAAVKNDSRYRALSVTNPDGAFPPGILFDRVELKEPKKAYVLAFDEGLTSIIKRSVYITIWGRTTDQYSKCMSTSPAILLITR